MRFCGRLTLGTVAVALLVAVELLVFLLGR
jgi:hypothetical protein